MKQSYLQITNCSQNNLKNISLTLPKDKIIVFTGVSGSGKSSLAFDTLFAEGQRRYLEFLSLPIRSLIKQIPKPAVDFIEGLSPTLAIGQGKQALYSRGTVATYTDIYDFLSLLYSKIGEQHSPLTGKRLIRYSRQEIVDLILKDYPLGSRIQLLAPIKRQRESIQEVIARLQQMGFIRFKIDDQEMMLEEELPSLSDTSRLEAVVDRIEIKEDIRDRLNHSIETAMDLSQGILKVQEGRQGDIRYFTEIYVCPETSYSFLPLGPADFNFNSSKGACPVCQGNGGQEKINADLFDWDNTLSLTEQIETILEVFPKRTTSTLLAIWMGFLEKKGIEEDALPSELSPDFLREVLYGSSVKWEFRSDIEEERASIVSWKGLFPLLEAGLQDKKSKTGLSTLPFVEQQTCSACKGARLKPESLACLIDGKNISQLCHLTVSSLYKEIRQWKFQGKQEAIADEILPLIRTRLQFLEQVGLGYLQLDRQGKTLSDGEKQRIQLAAQIGAKLSGILYILDEPSLGLHRQDIRYLALVIQELKALGNSIILVEHERSLIATADYVVELGPGAGQHGGFITFQGPYSKLLEDSSSLTGGWLSGRLAYSPPPKRKIGRDKIRMIDVSLHNLNHLSISIPLGCLVGLCGVSGSGKSTLALDILAEEVRKALYSFQPSAHVTGFDQIKRLVVSEKHDERLSPRSTPATYVGLMTPLRQLMAETRLSKARGYTPARFSLNKKGGRCEACEGLGQLRINLQLMPDIFVACEVCNGQRYNYETLQVAWEGYNMADILNMSVEKASEVFQHHPFLGPKLRLLKELGLEYLTLGQPFNTLSGGEIQRLKLVADLGTPSLEKTLYILDEPSAGLHFQDIEKLLRIFHRLVDEGHSILLIEHHLDILKQADWLIELGPGGGPEGGQLLFEGPPKKLQGLDTPTGRVLQS